MDVVQFAKWRCDFHLEKKVSSLVMGILNVTPDSFYEASRHVFAETALKQALELVSQGADIIDIGGESTRPDACKVSLQEELDRIMPVIERLRGYTDACISLDTYKPEVMREGIRLGVNLINDVKALQEDGALEILADNRIPICLMHMYGNPQTMCNYEHEDKNVLDDVTSFLSNRVALALQHGISKQDIIVDPGIGFGKTTKQNINLIQKLDALNSLGFPVLVGLSRKRMIGELTGKPVAQRANGSLAANIMAVLNGARIVRTHDPLATKEALLVVNSLINQ